MYGYLRMLKTEIVAYHDNDLPTIALQNDMPNGETAIQEENFM